MPVDKDINLDDPEGITSEDLRRMNEEADELERIAEKAEKNAEKVAQSKKQLEGLSFAQLNIMDKSMSGEGFDIDQLKEIINQVLTERDSKDSGLTKKDKEQDAHIKKFKEELKKAKEEWAKKQIELKENKELQSQIESGFNDVLGASRNPLGFGMGKVMSIAGKAGIAGAIAMMIWKVAEMVYKDVVNSFKAGGANDIRKMMLDADKEHAELKDILDRRAGRVFFTGDVDLRQGAPQFSNTERLRDQALRYQALHLGE